MARDVGVSDQESAAAKALWVDAIESLWDEGEFRGEPLAALAIRHREGS